MHIIKLLELTQETLQCAMKMLMWYPGRFQGLYGASRVKFCMKNI